MALHQPQSLSCWPALTQCSPLKTPRAAHWAIAVVVLAAAAGCSNNGRPEVRADTFPMGEAGRFDQPVPTQPLFGKTDYLRSHDVLPVALADIRTPLPAAVPLPAKVAQVEVIQQTDSNAQSGASQGGVTPAAGQAAAITNAQGSGEEHKLDAGSAK